MSNLLQVVRLQSEALKRNIVPIMVEFQINPDAAPFLVSSTKGLLWVEEAHSGKDGKIVKSAARQDFLSPGALFWEVVEAVSDRGKRDGWGNTHPFSEAGVRVAIEYVQSYDLTELELLIPRLRTEGEEKGPLERPEWLNPKNFQVPCRPTSWLPDDCVVVAPQDRQYVGLLGHLNVKSVVVCVHNASRGLAFAKGT